MLSNVDRFASHECRSIKVGDFIRLPLSLGDEQVYRHTWQVVSFPVSTDTGNNPTWFRRRDMAHCVTVRRLADGLTKTIAQHWYARYAA